MNDEYGTNRKIPEIPNPITPERSNIEIWPGRPLESKPVPLEGPGTPIQETDVESTPPVPQTQSGGAGRGGRGSKPSQTSSFPFENSGGQMKGPTPSDPDIPSVDEVSTYWSFRDKSHFGIAISKAGLDQYAEQIRRHVASVPSEQARKIAEHFVVQHQIHHFLIDRAVASIEAITGESLWLPMQYKYSASTEGYSPLEESLSCAYARRQTNNELFIKGHRVLLTLQPTGYQFCNDDGTKIKTSAGNVTHAQALSTLLSGYAQQKDTPRNRILGVHGLMLFKNHLTGTNGDLYYAVNGNKVPLMVYYTN